MEKQYEQEPPTDMDIWNDLQRQINALKEKQRWIPVSERLPEKANRVFVYMKNNYTIIATYFINSHVWRDDQGSSTSNVTHWMTLPEPPKEEE